MKKNGNVSENRQSVCYRGYERNGRNAYEWDDRVSSILKSGQIGGNPERVINNAKVSDHHAILPTKEALENGMEGLSDGKKNLMLLIGQQLVQATGEDYRCEQTEIAVQCNEHEFTAKENDLCRWDLRKQRKHFESPV